MLGKGVYRYKYIDGWKKFNEIFLTEIEDIYSHQHMEDVTDADYTHAKRISKDLKIKNLGENYDFDLVAICY